VVECRFVSVPVVLSGVDWLPSWRVVIVAKSPDFNRVIRRSVLVDDMFI